jgi:hypothetical protein
MWPGAGRRRSAGRVAADVAAHAASTSVSSGCRWREGGRELRYGVVVEGFVGRGVRSRLLAGYRGGTGSAGVDRRGGWFAGGKPWFARSCQRRDMSQDSRGEGERFDKSVRALEPPSVDLGSVNVRSC